MINRGEVNLEIDRPDLRLLDQLQEFDVPTLHEAHKAMDGWSLLPPLFSCTSPDARCVGVAVTALLPEGDNLAAQRLLSITEPGDVMVMTSVQSSGFTGMLGDMMAVCAQARGVRGVVANGSIRDLNAISEMGLPVWYRRINAIGMRQQRMAGLNVPIALDGVIVRPGAVVVADSDGVLVLEPDDVPEVAERAAQRRNVEAEIRPRLEAGESPYDIRQGSL